MGTFGERLKLSRKSKNISQAKLAKKLYMTAPNICRYENDLTLPPFDVIQKIAAILNVSAEWLCGNETNDKISVTGLDKKQKMLVQDLVSLLSKGKETRYLSENKERILSEVTKEIYTKP